MPPFALISSAAKVTPTFTFSPITAFGPETALGTPIFINSSSAFAICTYTNTQKMIQEFSAEFVPVVEKTSLVQLADLLKALGVGQKADHHEVLAEVLSLLPEAKKDTVHLFFHTQQDNPNRLYNHGCDHVVMRFDGEFRQAFENIKIDLYETV